MESAQIRKKPNVLILKNTRFLSKEDINLGKYRLFSSELEGIIIQRVVDKSLQYFPCGNFEFHGVYFPRAVNSIKPLAHIYFFLKSLVKILRLNNRKRFEYILGADPFSSGLMGYIFSKITGAKLIVEINGNYGERKTWGADRKSLIGKLKYHYCQNVVPFVVSRAFGTKLLYPQQLDSYARKISSNNVRVFHEYVPVRDFKFSKKNDGYILFLGAPWHAKGIDLLVRAFDDLSPLYSGRLLIVGWLSQGDIEQLKALAPNNAQIEYQPPVFYDEAQELISRCDFLVLPSRTEAMGRVIMEARAHGKAVIGSSVDGIPFYIDHNQTGLLFESGDWEELRIQMERMIGEQGLKESLARQGYEIVRSSFDERSYLKCYLELMKVDALRYGTRKD